VTISLTNPGTIGTVHSVPRLMAGQGAIIGAGAMEYPAEFQGASEERIAELGIGKLITLTSTYDHRIIQGAESGDFLRTIHELLLDDEFYDEIFFELGIPYEPVRWRTDNPDSIVDKNARVIELIAAYRNRGHLMADIDPLRLDKTRSAAPRPRREHPRPHAVGPRPRCSRWGFAGKEYKKLRDVLGAARRLLPAHRRRVHPHPRPEQQKWLQERIEVKHEKPTVASRSTS
jgi:2-oxoglutarate decarboxylase